MGGIAAPENLLNTDQILGLLDDPAGLEALYRGSPDAFRSALARAVAAHPDEIVLRVWVVRLSEPVRSEPAALRLGPAVGIALCCGLLARLPAIWLGAEWYYPRFLPSIGLLGAAGYLWIQTRPPIHAVLGVVLAAVTTVYVSLLPGLGDSVVMALIHLPILWWVFLGLVFTGAGWREQEPRIRFLRYNGELLILGSLVVLGGLVFSAITAALFELVSSGSGEWYAENLGVMGAAGVPVAATYLYDAVFRRHTGIPAVLARIFSPLFLVMTVTYLVVAAVVGRNPFVDREFLITVNGLLLVVLGMTVLSIAERREYEQVGWIDRINLALLTVTLVTDVLALSAILFRLTSFGFTPNRVVVLGANVVILAHLVLLGRAQVSFVRGLSGGTQSQRAATRYLPAYAAWAAIACFVLPLVFQFS